jgi:hypothetical protein
LKNIEQDIREISHDLNREKSELINNFVAIVNVDVRRATKTFATKLVSTIDKFEMGCDRKTVKLTCIVFFKSPFKIVISMQMLLLSMSS